MKNWKEDPKSYYNQSDIRYAIPTVIAILFSFGMAVIFDKIFLAGQVGLIIGLVISCPIVAIMVWRGDKKIK